jgi:hypothetical protein
MVTYLIEYLGEFEFIFETLLDYESGDQMGSFDAKNLPLKISCLVTFKVSWDSERSASCDLTFGKRKKNQQGQYLVNRAGEGCLDAVCCHTVSLVLTSTPI